MPGLLACLPAKPLSCQGKVLALGFRPFLLLWSSCLVAWFVSVCCFFTFSLSGDKIQSVQSVCLSVFWLFSLLLVCWSSRLGSVCLYVWPCPRLLLSWAFSCPGPSLVLGLLLSWPFSVLAFSCPRLLSSWHCPQWFSSRQCSLGHHCCDPGWSASSTCEWLLTVSSGCSLGPVQSLSDYTRCYLF